MRRFKERFNLSQRAHLHNGYSKVTRQITNNVKG